MISWAATPSLARFGVNPFSIPALLSFAFCLVNLGWICLRFKETLPESAQNGRRQGNAAAQSPALRS